jgi:hypothetical protein
MVFSEVFWTGFYTASGALVLALINQCYKSKCKQIDICCIKIVRDVAVEEVIDSRPLSPIRANL